MHPKYFRLSTRRPPLQFMIATGSVLLIGASILLAQPKEPNVNLAQNSDGECGEEQILPRPPRLFNEEEASWIPGVSNSAPSIHKAEPDETKLLLGYYGPYYNVKDLNGEVIVLKKTIRTGNGNDLWKATGIVRNQSCQAIHIDSIEAEAFDSRGESLGIALAAVSVKELRPGEPAPFTVEANLPLATVGSVLWRVNSRPISRLDNHLRINVYENRQAEGQSLYSLFGSLTNTSNETLSKVSVVAAWLDSQGRLIYLAYPKMRSAKDPLKTKSEVSLAPKGVEDFVYTTNDPYVVALLKDSQIALWGIFK